MKLNLNLFSKESVSNGTSGVKGDNSQQLEVPSPSVGRVPLSLSLSLSLSHTHTHTRLLPPAHFCLCPLGLVGTGFENPASGPALLRYPPQHPGKVTLATSCRTEVMIWNISGNIATTKLFPVKEECVVRKKYSLRNFSPDGISCPLWTILPLGVSDPDDLFWIYRMPWDMVWFIQLVGGKSACPDWGLGGGGSDLVRKSAAVPALAPVGKSAEPRILRRYCSFDTGVDIPWTVCIRVDYQETSPRKHLQGDNW